MPRSPGPGGWAAAMGTRASKVADLAAEVAGQPLALTGAVLLLVDPGVVGVAVGLVAAVAALVLVVRLIRRQAARGEVLGLAAGTRMVLLLVVAGGYLLRRPGDAGWVWTATGAALWWVLLEPVVRTALGRTEQVAVQLPGVRPVPAPPFPPGRLPLVGVATIVAGGALAALGVPGWVYLVVVALAGVATGAQLAHAYRAASAARQAVSAVQGALEQHRPEFAVYYAGTAGARYQLGMWLPYLERLQRPFVVLTRHAETVPVISSLTSAPVVVPHSTSAHAALEQLVVPSLRAAFYVQGSTGNAHLQRHRRLTHVWLNHGDSDKAANFSAKHAAYDRVFVSGEQGVQRYAEHGVRIPPERFVRVGRPQVERIEPDDGPRPPGAVRTVLYAPTWRGGRPATDYSSLPVGEQIVGALLARGDTVIFRPHPLSHTDPADAAVVAAIQRRLRQDSSRAHVWGDRAETTWDVADCVNACDALVTDVSSVASDALASGKPLAMVAVRARGEEFRRQFPMARVAYVIEGDLSTLDEALDQLHGDDPLAVRRRAYRTYCLGEELGPRAADPFLWAATALLVDGG